MLFIVISVLFKVDVVILVVIEVVVIDVEIVEDVLVV